MVKKGFFVLVFMVVIGLPVFAEVAWYFIETSREPRVGDTIWYTEVPTGWSTNTWVAQTTIREINGNRVWVEFPSRAYLTRKINDTTFSVFYNQQPEAFRLSLFGTNGNERYKIFIMLPNGNVTGYILASERGCIVRDIDEK